MNDNDRKRGGIDKKYQGAGNVEEATTTLQASGTHTGHKNNSTCKHVELV